jgi:hypothetical protein
MNGESIIKNPNCSCDPSVMSPHEIEQIMAKQQALAGMAKNFKSPISTQAELEPVQGLMNEILDVTEQIERLSEDIRYQIMGPVPQCDQGCG